jgi:hypothetical protein
LLQILVMWDLDLFSIQWWQAYVKSILIDDNKLFLYDFFCSACSNMSFSS